MADIGRYCINDVIDRLTLLVAAQQGMADEGMSQIVKARSRMAAACDPLQTGAQFLESGMSGAVGQRFATIRNAFLPSFLTSEIHTKNQPSAIIHGGALGQPGLLPPSPPQASTHRTNSVTGRRFASAPAPLLDSTSSRGERHHPAGGGII
jgi:hypothetical protein